MKKRLFGKVLGGAALSTALLALTASCSLTNKESDKEADKEEMKMELAEIEKEGTEVVADMQTENEQKEDSVDAIDNMVATVEDAGNIATSDWKAKYNGAFFTNAANKANVASASKYAETASGLKYSVITPGTGRRPGPTQSVTVHYTGMLPDGTVFDSSIDRGEPTTFPLNRVIPGWTEGLQLMKEGGVAVFYIPSNLGYGERGVPGTIPGGSPLIFWVQLLSVN